MDIDKVGTIRYTERKTRQNRHKLCRSMREIGTTPSFTVHEPDQQHLLLFRNSRIDQFLRADLLATQNAHAIDNSLEPAVADPRGMGLDLAIRKKLLY